MYWEAVILEAVHIAIVLFIATKITMREAAVRLRLSLFHLDVISLPVLTCLYTEKDEVSSFCRHNPASSTNSTDYLYFYVMVMR